MKKVAKKKMASTRKRKKNVVPPSIFEVILMYIFQGLKRLLSYISQTLKRIQIRRLARKIRDFNDE